MLLASYFRIFTSLMEKPQSSLFFAHPLIPYINLLQQGFLPAEEY